MEELATRIMQVITLETDLDKISRIQDWRYFVFHNPEEIKINESIHNMNTLTSYSRKVFVWRFDDMGTAPQLYRIIMKRIDPSFIDNVSINDGEYFCAYLPIPKGL